MSASESFILLTNRVLSENLEGRSSVALHRVLKHIPGGTRGCRLMVRDEAYVDQLRDEGVSLDGMGRLNEGNCFWDFSLHCQRAYDAKLAAAAGAVVAADSDGAGGDGGAYGGAGDDGLDGPQGHQSATPVAGGVGSEQEKSHYTVEDDGDEDCKDNGRSLDKAIEEHGLFHDEV
jgi:hypothetical protein